MVKSRDWARLLALLLVVGYVSQSPGLVMLGSMMGAILVACWLFYRLAFTGVSYERKLQYWRTFPGEEVGCQVSVANRKIMPLIWLNTHDRWPMAVAPLEARALTASSVAEEGLLSLVLMLRGFERVRRNLHLRFRKRGVFMLGPAMGESGDPLGLFHARRQLAPAKRLVVFPALKPLESLKLKPRDPFGYQASRRMLFEDCTMTAGVRGYRPEDGLHRVHWKATARTGELQSRVYQPVSGLDLVICLNVSTFKHYWVGIRPAMLEDLLSTAASVAAQAYNAGYRVGLMCNGSLAHAGRPFRLAAGRSPQQLSRLLETLAAVTPIVNTHFERLLISQAPQMEYGSTLLIITAIFSPELAETLVRLRGHGRNLVLISLAADPPPQIHGIETLHSPHQATPAEVAA
jgi:uncharacterized protein (DUF58 family)